MRVSSTAVVLAALVVGGVPEAPSADVGTAARAIAIVNRAGAADITALHRIGVRRVKGAGAEFFDTLSGKTFIPRGNNFIRLRNGYHSTFDPGAYDASGAEVALSEMSRYGYNVVRVFLNVRAMGRRPGEPGLNAEYMRNLLDFLARASRHDVWVMISNQWLPPNYGAVIGDGPVPENVEGINAVFMSPGGIGAAERFWTDVVTWIKTANPGLLSTVFSYDLWNESYFQSDQKPFSLTQGIVKPAGGGIYDMADPASRQAAADSSVQHWANRLTDAIKRVDPLALTTASVFTPRGVGRAGYDGVQPSTDPRVPMRAVALSRSSLDYLEFHTYPAGPHYSLAEDLASVEIDSLATDKPVVIGEFGALKRLYRDPLAAAIALVNHQSASCAHRVTGWVLWMWDSDLLDWPDIWTALESPGTINRLLAPVTRPDACSRFRALPIDRLGDSARNGMDRRGTAARSMASATRGTAEIAMRHRRMKPMPDNPRGFNEHQLLNDIDEEILARLGGSWSEPPPFAAGWETAPALPDLRQRACDVIHADFGAAPLRY